MVRWQGNGRFVRKIRSVVFTERANARVHFLRNIASMSQVKEAGLRLPRHFARERCQRCVFGLPMESKEVGVLFAT